MIIIWRYIRSGRIHKEKATMKWYRNRNTHLLEPVYWLYRDHCWIEWQPRYYMKYWWYLIWWNHQRYIDSQWYEKSSVVPTWKICLFSRSDKKYMFWRRYIYKPMRKWYNVNIKNMFYYKNNTWNQHIK